MIETDPPAVGSPPGVVLVTGVARALGAAFAKDLAATGVEVIGVDLTPTRYDIGLARYVRGDITSPSIANLIISAGVEAVVHLALVSSGGSEHARTAAKEINVVGAMQLFAACQQSARVRKLVVQSSINVYGAGPRDPARFTEDLTDAHQPASGLGKDAVEVETYARGLARRRPDITVTTLRLANLLGAGHQSQIAQWLRLPVVPRILGFDARMQFLHPDDAVAALRLVTDQDVPGTFNVAADDIVTLSYLLRRLDRPSVGLIRQSLPLMTAALRKLPGAESVAFTRDELDALTYGRVMDTGRFAEASGFQPQHSSADVVDEFVASVLPARAADPGRHSRPSRSAVDEFGFDPEFTDQVWLPMARELSRTWFRCETRGIENLPVDGPAMLVANHAGTLPLDGMVLQSVVHDEISRLPRMLGADLIFQSPFTGTFARRIGTTLACQADAARLLRAGHLVSVFPEGFKGVGKLWSQRYKLQRFGRGGFVATAISAGVPIIPVSIVGSEETYPNLANIPFVARSLGLPHFPITPLFPLLGPFGAVPLPSKWIIGFGTPVPTDQLEPGAAEDPMVVFNVTDQVRETIQHSLYVLLAERGRAFGR